MAGNLGYQRASEFPQLVDLDPILTDIFYQHLPELDPMLEMFFRVLDSSKAKETDLRVGSFGDPEAFTGQVHYDAADPDYEVEYVPTEYTSGFKVQRAMIDTMQYNNIFERPEDMARAFGRKIEKDAASVFNNAFSTAGYDAVSLCNDSHPRSSTDSTAVDNNATLALTKTNLQTVRLQGEALVDDRGELINWDGNLLLVPPNLRDTAHELTMSEQDPESAENASNPYQGLQYRVWRRLTDSTAWFLIDTTLMQRYLKWYWLVRPEFAAIEDFDTLVRKYRGYMRYSYGWSDFRWVVGSTGGD